MQVFCFELVSVQHRDAMENNNKRGEGRWGGGKSNRWSCHPDFYMTVLARTTSNIACFLLCSDITSLAAAKCPLEPEHDVTL